MAGDILKDGATARRPRSGLERDKLAERVEVPFNYMSNVQGAEGREKLSLARTHVES